MFYLLGFVVLFVLWVIGMTLGAGGWVHLLAATAVTVALSGIFRISKTGNLPYPPYR